ncbi:MAG: MarP family serine protease [Acidimicrobiales bacterium]
MSLLDLIVALVALGAAVWGYRFGFLTAVLSLAGLFGGVYLAARLVPSTLSLGSFDPTEMRLVAIITLLLGATIGFNIGLFLGSRLHAVLPFGAARSVDRGAGSAIAIVGVLALLWLLLPSIAAAPGWPARAAQQSALARWVSRQLPVPPNAVEVLRRLFGGATSPQVFSALQSGSAAGPPPTQSPLSPAVTATVTASTVRVQGQGCNSIIEGSGFAVAPNLVVTNAHVVAGEPAGQTSVLLTSGRRLPARVVLFDPERDLALLSVPGLGEAPLPIATGHAGEVGAVFGHPEGQRALAVQPASISQQINAVGLDLYDQHKTRRAVFVLAAVLQHGDSGAPLVTTTGDVVGVVFAIAANQPTTAYALTSAELQADLAAPRTGAAISTGPCLTFSG